MASGQSHLPQNPGNLSSITGAHRKEDGEKIVP